MVLTVHASSTCDVCLEPYDWDNNNSKPHFIACGHVFCRTCLEHIQPKKCPLCRTLFTTSDIQRLNVDPYSSPVHPQSSDVEAKLLELPPLDDRDEFANDLMKKLVMSYECVDEELLLAADAWLQERGFIENCPVRKARDMIKDYQDLKSKKRKDKRKIKELLCALQDSKTQAEENAARLAEEVRRQDALRCQIDINEKEIERLREKVRIQGSLLDPKGKKKQSPLSNPLPIPPRPVGTSARAYQLFNVNHEASPPPVTPYTVNPIHAPAPRYPESRKFPPGITHRFGLLTFNNPMQDSVTPTTDKIWRHHQPRQFHERDLGPGQVEDDDTYWTCRTTTNLLPETRTPGYDLLRGSIPEQANGGGKHYGA